MATASFTCSLPLAPLTKSIRPTRLNLLNPNPVLRSAYRTRRVVIRSLAVQEDDKRTSDESSMSIDNLRGFVDLNVGKWIGSFHQFDGNGSLLHKIDTRLSASSYGEDELISLNQSLYIKQPTSATSVTEEEEEEPEWVEYKIKETNMFTVDKYQQVLKHFGRAVMHPGRSCSAPMPRGMDHDREQSVPREAYRMKVARYRISTDHGQYRATSTAPMLCGMDERDEQQLERTAPKLCGMDHGRGCRSRTNPGRTNTARMPSGMSDEDQYRVNQSRAKAVRYDRAVIDTARVVASKNCPGSRKCTICSGQHPVCPGLTRSSTIHYKYV